jgi:transposase
MLFRVRGLPIRQKTRAITALRGHPGGFGQIVPQGAFGQIVPQGAAGASKPTASVEDPDSGLPADAIPSLEGPIGTLMQVESEIGTLETGIARRAREDDVARRLMTVPGIGPPIATAQVTLAPPPEMFRRGRDFAAWPGLAPRPHSTGGRQRLGATTKPGERSLRRLPIIGASSVILKRHVHAAARPGTWLGAWPGGMPTRKPPMRVRVALAHRMARVVRAFAIGLERMATNGSLARGGVCKSPAPAAQAHRRLRGRRSGRGQAAVWRNRRETGSGDPGCNRVPPGPRP